ncbi:MAG: hypothetical protein LKF43_00270 [Streptococcaceae bacterium]|jgi:hypothetical protein|nr:hypothetical protein [Streptococcaceae bacterium]
MSNQITVSETRKGLEAAESIIPIMNDIEYVQLFQLFGRVLDRYEKENYPNGEVSE